MSFTPFDKQSAHPDAAAIAEKTARALALRIRGFSYRRIADELSIGKSAAHTYVIAALEEIREQNSEDARQLRQLELERLDKMQADLTPVGENLLDPRTADTIIRIMERRARLIGLDAPVDARLGGLPGGPPIALSNELDLTKLSVAQLRELHDILATASPALPLPPST